MASSDKRPEELRKLTNTTPVDDGFGTRRFPGAEEQSAPTDVALEAQLQAIRDQNYSPRKLRLARRIASMHQLEVTSDEEAVLRLRELGIDPFHRGAVGQALSAAAAENNRQPAKNAPVPRTEGGSHQALARIKIAKVPSTEVSQGRLPSGLPSKEEMTEERRAREILEMRRDIARRRRRQSIMLAIRLAFFVFLPTVIAGWYFYEEATPLYGTESQFQIQMADSPAAASASMMGAVMANSDFVAVQSYLESRNAMLRLNEDIGFKRIFQDPSIDILRRLPPDASDEDAFDLYKNLVTIGYDPTEGLMNMEVIAPEPDLSRDISLLLIEYAEGEVDNLTSRIRGDQLTGAQENYEAAANEVTEAQQRVLEIQEQLGVLNANAEETLVMTEVQGLQSLLTQKELALAALLANERPNQSRVSAVQGEIERLEAQLEETRTQLTDTGTGGSSIAEIQGQLRNAEAELQTAHMILREAATSRESARIEAGKQVRYLSVSVAPVPPDEPTYPRAFENTVVAFLIFCGIYLMLSLTASILREQVSS